MGFLEGLCAGSRILGMRERFSCLAASSFPGKSSKAKAATYNFFPPYLALTASRVQGLDCKNFWFWRSPLLFDLGFYLNGSRSLNLRPIARSRTSNFQNS